MPQEHKDGFLKRITKNANKTKPSIKRFAHIVYSSVNDLSKQRTADSHGNVVRASISEIVKYHEYYEIPIDVKVFVRLFRFADDYQLSKS